MKQRLDKEMFARGMVQSRSQADSLIELERVKVNGKVAHKSSQMVDEETEIDIQPGEQFVSRAALKLKSVAGDLNIVFKDKTVLDIGSSTGGFTEYSLHKGAKKVIAIDVGTNQLHPSLRSNPKIELHEKTDFRDFAKDTKNFEDIELVLIDVSFVSIREILKPLAKAINANTTVIAMVKPQFEAGEKQKNKGVVKNNSMRRQILKDFEDWAKGSFVIKQKADSGVSGEKGNVERFYKLGKLG